MKENKLVELSMDFAIKIIKLCETIKGHYSLKTYNDYQGFLIRKYKSFFGKYVFVIEQDSNTVKFYVGKGIFDSVAVGSKLTVGLLGKKLINIRPGFCNSVNE